MQELIELIGCDALYRFFFRNHALFDHVDGDAHGGRPGPLAVARLQHVELAFFDGEFEILHIAIMLFEIAGDFAELVVGFGHHLLKLCNRLRSANAGHHIFALRIDQKLAVENLFAG